MPDERKESATAFLKAAIAYYQSLGITVVRVMTDNGSCYKAFDFRHACRDLGLKHIRTKPYTPKTNGKAERFIQSALREWAYAQPYTHSDRRTAELPRWLHRYNWHRPHGSLDAQPPISRLGISEDNLLRLHSYRRIHALIRRQRREQGGEAVNVKRVYRIMKQNGLLLVWRDIREDLAGSMKERSNHGGLLIGVGVRISLKSRVGI